jgi:hypothetical protein
VDGDSGVVDHSSLGHIIRKICWYAPSTSFKEENDSIRSTAGSNVLLKQKSQDPAVVRTHHRPEEFILREAFLDYLMGLAVIFSFRLDKNPFIVEKAKFSKRMLRGSTHL